jgi:endonuclease G, mitochondrial
MGSRIVLASALVAAILLLNEPTALAADNCADQFHGGKEPTSSARHTTSFCYREFAVLYSGVTKTPVWSAEHLTAARVRKAATLPRPKYGPFHTDDNLPVGHRSMLADYHSVGKTLDRGHRAPNGDMSDDESQFNSFALSNIVPQAACNNELIWEGIESAVRNLAKRYGEVYVVTGPIYSNQPPDTIGRDKVAVPTRLFKAVFDSKLGAPGVYITTNSNDVGDDYQILSVKEFAKQTGIDPFPSLLSNLKAAPGSLPAPDQPHFSCRLH